MKINADKTRVVMSNHSWLIICVTALTILFLIFTNALKATDPGDLNYDPSDFKFTDYPLSEYPKVFDKLFPLGTDRKFIENVLVSSGGAHVEYLHDIVIYSWQPPLVYFPKGLPTWGHGFNIDTHHVAILYDRNNKEIAAQSSVGWGVNYQAINDIDDAETGKFLSPNARAVIKEKQNQGGR